MNKEEVFINYYFKKRIRRVTHAPDELHKIYSSKYFEWIIPFLKKYNITDAPLILCCNTLYQLPDFFTLGKNSFFVADYYLHSFLYDFNYSLSESYLNDLCINLFLKTYMEKAYLKNNIDSCFFLCSTSPTIEEYKHSDDYINENKMSHLVEITDLQEEFTFLHEAGHFLLEKYKSLKESEFYKTVKKEYFNIKCQNKDDFYDECFCDYVSSIYILNETYDKCSFEKSDYFSLFFRTLLCVYIIEFFSKCQELDPVLFFEYSDEQLQMILLRYHNLYIVIQQF
ncbi:MAG: hypothetical protein IJ297_05930, partial [Clostridia bacterium]|nr:hypothetical protein [Clostridia bacterium]